MLPCGGVIECRRGCTGATRSRPPAALIGKGLYEPRKGWSGEVRSDDTSPSIGDGIDDGGVLWCVVRDCTWRD